MKYAHVQRIALAMVAGGLALGLGACSTLFGPQYRAGDGKITAAASIDSSSLQVGDCIVNVSDLGDSVNKIAVVPCTTPHEAEVYATSKSQANDKTTLDQFCTDAFQPYVGIDFDETALEVTYIHSDEKQATTDVQCILYQTGQMVTSSYKDSQQ